MPQDQRRHPRIEAMLELCLSDRGDVWQAVTGNVSVSGIFVNTRELREVGSECEIEFNLHGRRHQASAVVRWTTDFDDIVAGMGVEFSSLQLEALRALYDFVTSRH